MPKSTHKSGNLLSGFTKIVSTTSKIIVAIEETKSKVELTNPTCFGKHSAAVSTETK